MADNNFVFAVHNKLLEVKSLHPMYIYKPYGAMLATFIKLIVAYVALIFLCFNPVFIFFLVIPFLILLYVVKLFVDYCGKFGFNKTLMWVLLACVAVGIGFLMGEVRHAALMLYQSYFRGG